MGLVDELTAKVPGAGAGTATAVAAEDPSKLIAAILAMIDEPKTGGFAGLVQGFQDKGLGSIIAGWISPGHNPPITPAQVQTALGTERLQQLTRWSGEPLESLPEQLAAILPIVVDHLTPDGQVPPSGTPLNQAMDWLDARG